MVFPGLQVPLDAAPADLQGIRDLFELHLVVVAHDDDLLLIERKLGDRGFDRIRFVSGLQLRFRIMVRQLIVQQFEEFRIDFAAA